MIFKDLRQWLEEVEKMNDVLKIENASLEDEVGGLVEVYQQEMGKPCLLFDEFDNYEKGYRILANSCSSIKRIALTLNMSPECSEMEIVGNWRKFLANYRSVKPNFVQKASVLENKHYGDEINLEEFPIPMWHPDDGGRYIGTGCIVVTKDPDTDWVNCGAYRMMLQDKDKANLFIVKGKHGSIIRDKYWKQGKPLPVAVSLGHDPIYFLIGGMEIPYGESEYDFIGAIRNNPVDLINTPLYNIPVPAESEIVIEGEVWPDDTLPEGPFGEWTGYYAGGRREAPVMRVKGIYHRNSPILLGAIPSIPPSDINYYRSPLRAAAVWDQLEKAGVPGVKSVWAHEVGGARMLLIVAIEQLYPGHSRQVGLIASQCHAAAYANKAVIVVDSDIDVTSLNQVVWAVLTRTNPSEDIDILRKCWTSKVDPTSYPPGKNHYNDRVVIDACRAWDLKDDFPKVITIAPDTLKKIKTKWPELF